MDTCLMKVPGVSQKNPRHLMSQKTEQKREREEQSAVQAPQMSASEASSAFDTVSQSWPMQLSLIIAQIHSGPSASVKTQSS